MKTLDIKGNDILNQTIDDTYEYEVITEDVFYDYQGNDFEKILNETIKEFNINQDKEKNNKNDDLEEFQLNYYDDDYYDDDYYDDDYYDEYDDR